MSIPCGSDLAAFLELNRESEALLSPLDEPALRDLLATAYCTRLSTDRQSMLIALDQEANYDSPNFRWFRERYPRFVYVDRIAVAKTVRGRGCARALYEALIDHARGDRHAVICAEVCYEPPNPASDALHAAFGFEEVGRARLADRGKSVRYLVLNLCKSEAGGTGPGPAHGRIPREPASN